jgi:hypothetical protein
LWLAAYFACAKRATSKSWVYQHLSPNAQMISQIINKKRVRSRCFLSVGKKVLIGVEICMVTLWDREALSRKKEEAAQISAHDIMIDSLSSSEKLFYQL